MLTKEYQNTARTLRRVAQNMTDQTTADRLEALAREYERRAEKALLTAKTLARSAARGECERSTQEKLGLRLAIGKDAGE
jgi:hypothetical protein